MLSLFAAQTANVNGATVRTVNNVPLYSATIAVWGTMGGATVIVQFSPDAGTTWIDFATPVTTLTAKSFVVTLPSGCAVRAAITGGTAASISVAIFD